MNVHEADSFSIVPLTAVYVTVRDEDCITCFRLCYAITLPIALDRLLYELKKKCQCIELICCTEDGF